jgi:hypothetical protein
MILKIRQGSLDHSNQPSILNKNAQEKKHRWQDLISDNLIK